jgi:hypothetical protein
MARPAATYRGARSASARASKTPMVKFTVIKELVPGTGESTGDQECSRIVALPEPRYMPYFCKEPRIKFGLFQVGPVPSPADVTVPYTDLRKQPRVYR